MPDDDLDFPAWVNHGQADHCEVCGAECYGVRCPRCQELD